MLHSLFERVLLVQQDPVRNRLLVLEIQEELIARTVRTEGAIRQTKKSIKAFRQEIRAVSRDDRRVRGISGQLKLRQSLLASNQDYLEILRTIGDALAFIFGDRFDLKPLAFREAPGFIGGKRGARLERAMLRIAFEQGHVAILNDLTHTLRHGDVTVFNSDGTFRLFEAKSGRGGDYARNKRQLEATQSMAKYLVTDVREEEGGVWQRVAVNATPTDHSAFVTNALQHLPPAGWSLTEVEPGLHYLLIDCAIGSLNEEMFSGLDRSKPVELISVNDMKYERMGYMPFPLLIRDANLLCRFYTGQLVINILVGLDRVNELLSRHGLSITFGDDPYMHWKVHDDSGAKYESFVSAHFVGRLAAEFVKLEWLVENIAVTQGAFRDMVQIRQNQV